MPPPTGMADPEGCGICETIYGCAILTPSILDLHVASTAPGS